MYLQETISLTVTLTLSALFVSFLLFIAETFFRDSRNNILKMHRDHTYMYGKGITSILLTFLDAVRAILGIGQQVMIAVLVFVGILFFFGVKLPVTDSSLAWNLWAAMSASAIVMAFAPIIISTLYRGITNAIGRSELKRSFTNDV